MKRFFRVTWLYWLAVCFLIGCTLTMVKVKDSNHTMIEVDPPSSNVGDVGNYAIVSKVQTKDTLMVRQVDTANGE